MLVLSRKAGQRIHIGDDVVITLTKIAGNRVKVGIAAPREVSIRRGEVAAVDCGSESPPQLRGLQLDAGPVSSYLATPQ